MNKIVGKKKSDLTNTRLLLTTSKLKLQLWYQQHLQVCRKPIKGPDKTLDILNFKIRKVLINSYSVSNFNHCALVWMSSGTKSHRRLLIKGLFVFLFSDYKSPYEILLSKEEKVTMNVNRLGNLGIKIYLQILIHKLPSLFVKSHNINPAFTNEIFKLKNNNRLAQED